MRFAVLTLPALAIAVALAPPARAAQPLLYVALGDSTAAGVGAEHGGGYPERLARRIEASGTPVRLVNLGMPGATAEDLRRAQLPRVLAEQPALVTIGIGVNDVLRGRPLAEYARDLEIIADTVSRSKAAVVISELPDLPGAPSAAGSPRAVARRVAAYNATIRLIAERHGMQVAALEATSRRAFAARPELLAKDGLHPSARGYDLWAEAMWPTVERALAPRVQARRAASPRAPER